MLSAGTADWEAWLSHIPCDIDATALAFGALRRRREVRDGRILLRLLVAYCATDMSFRQTAAWSSITGLAQITDVSLIQRFEQCQSWLAHLLGAILGDAPVPEGPSSASVSLVDATHLSSADGRLWRIHVQWNAQRGIEQVYVSDGQTGESLSHFKTLGYPSLWVADRAYTPSQLSDPSEAAVLRGELLCRLRSNLFKLPGGKRLLDAARPEEIVTVPVTYPGQVAGRIIIAPKPVETLEKAEKTARDKAQKHQQGWSQERQKSSQYLVLYTNNSTLSAEQLVSVYRYRWQIELLFKRLKSIQALDQTRLKSPSLCHVYILVHLILGAIAEKIIAQSRYSGLFPPQAVTAAFSLAAVSVDLSQFAPSRTG